MELIEGEPLAEHFASLREKQQRFTEERIWSIFIQVENYMQVFCLVLHSFSDLFKNSSPMRETANLALKN